MAYFARSKYKVVDEEGKIQYLEPGTEIKQGDLPDDVVKRGLETGSIIKGDKVAEPETETPSDNQGQETPADE